MFFWNYLSAYVQRDIVSFCHFASPEAQARADCVETATKPLALRVSAGSTLRVARPSLRDCQVTIQPCIAYSIFIYVHGIFDNLYLIYDRYIIVYTVL